MSQEAPPRSFRARGGHGPVRHGEPHSARITPTGRTAATPSQPRGRLIPSI